MGTWEEGHVKTEQRSHYAATSQRTPTTVKTTRSYKRQKDFLLEPSEKLQPCSDFDFRVLASPVLTPPVWGGGWICCVPGQLPHVAVGPGANDG